MKVEIQLMSATILGLEDASRRQFVRGFGHAVYHRIIAVAVVGTIILVVMKRNREMKACSPRARSALQG